MCVLCSSYTISCKMVEYETRLTEDGLPPERTLLCAFVWSLKKACIQTKRFWPTSRSVKSTPCCVCVPQSCCCTLVMLQPLTRIITLRRSCFTERGAPLEACTGRYERGCLATEAQCLTSSVTREHVCFASWPLAGGALLTAFVSEAFIFRVA